MASNNGELYVVATPIGNLADISQRALQVLNTVDVIAAEDTRHSRYLLQHYGIKTPLMALHQHNEARAANNILSQLQQQKNIALISDAGTPLVSDPGAKLVQFLHQNGCKIIPIPGASAVISALSVAGFSADKFVFEGFLASKTHAREKRLTELKDETRTLVFYEAPHRIVACIQSLLSIFGQREIALVKELTKCYETIYRAPLEDVLTWLQQESARQKGEFVLVVAGNTAKDKHSLTPEALRIFQILQQKMSLKDASKLASEITNISRKVFYQQGLINQNKQKV